VIEMTITMLDKKLDTIAKYNFGAYTIPEGYAIADPLDDADGFYLYGPELETLVDELIDCHQWRFSANNEKGICSVCRRPQPDGYHEHPCE
jgi:hypothetical protein